MVHTGHTEEGMFIRLATPDAPPLDTAMTTTPIFPPLGAKMIFRRQRQ